MKESFGVKQENPERGKMELFFEAQNLAQDILRDASSTKEYKERIKKEKVAYRIYAALIFLNDNSVPESIRKNTESLISHEKLLGFASIQSAEDFLNEQVARESLEKAEMAA